MPKTTTDILNDLLARRDTILTQLASLGPTTPGGLPNTSGTGDHVDHVGLRQSLYAELNELDTLLEKIHGPHQSVSRGRLT